MRTLHLAALPFPSPQGTQALIHQMLCALASAGHDTHLLCYGHGDVLGDAPYGLHRSQARSFTRSLRSGPSFDKLWLDAALPRELASTLDKLAPDRIVAHHVEAAAIACAVAPAHTTFVAHTSLREELPTYFPRRLSSALSWLGARIDRTLLQRAARCYAVSPMLAELLRVDTEARVDALPLPWPVPCESSHEERARARHALGFHTSSEVALYAGNLDAYQGLEALLPALAQLTVERPHFCLLIATAQPTARFERTLFDFGVRARFAPLADEEQRRRVHAAADCALVPRRSRGGVPIKLLDAFARGVPVLAAERALAGLPLRSLCSVVDGESKLGWEHAITELLEARPGARARARRARAYVGREHTPARFVSALLAG